MAGSTIFSRNKARRIVKEAMNKIKLLEYEDNTAWNLWEKLNKVFKKLGPFEEEPSNEAL